MCGVDGVRKFRTTGGVRGGEGDVTKKNKKKTDMPFFLSCAFGGKGNWGGGGGGNLSQKNDGVCIYRCCVCRWFVSRLFFFRFGSRGGNVSIFWVSRIILSWWTKPEAGNFHTHKNCVDPKITPRTKIPQNPNNNNSIVPKKNREAERQALFSKKTQRIFLSVCVFFQKTNGVF